MKKLNLKTVGAIGVTGMIALSVAGIQAAAVFAQEPTPQTQSAVVTATEDVSTGPDTGTIDEQVGDQTAADGVVDTAESTGAEVKANDTDNLNVEEQVGDQTSADNASTAAEAGN